MIHLDTLSRTVDQRIRFVHQLPIEVRKIPLAELLEGYVYQEEIWRAFRTQRGIVYGIYQEQKLSQREIALIELLLLDYEETANRKMERWQQELIDAIHLPTEAYSERTKIEDLDAIYVPFAFPIVTIGLRPKDRQQASHFINEIKGIIASFAEGFDLTYHVVVEPTFVVCIIEWTEESKTLELSAETIASSIVDGMLREAFLEVRAVYAQEILDFNTLVQTVRRMLFLALAAEGFQMEQPVIAIDGLGIHELLYSALPTLKKQYGLRVLPEEATKLLGVELEQTVMTFVENDLNMSETARQLYLHRNSLLYRIERIKEVTGYDIRRFSDAATVWAALLFHREGF